ncbi:MAG: peptide ABC transporter substrate-binding protein, partial [Cytophagales bacterium]|nr:peptide ABC transporter substrate-binding protein [Armatimonadota bacterium]
MKGLLLGVAVLSALPALMVLTGCGNDGSRTAPGVAGGRGAVPGVLRQALPVEPNTLDPALIQDTFTAEMVQNLYEGLVGWDEKNQIVPKVAAALPALSADGRTYTFTLRENVTFPGGKAVTSEDVKYSLTRALDPKLASPTAMSYLDDILGAKEVADGETPDLAGVTVVDPKTVRITLLAPRAYFLGKLTYPTGFIVSKEAVAKGPNTPAGARTIDGTNAGEAGTGPFRLASYTRASKLILDANPNYWAGKPKLSRIERPIVLDAKTVRNKYDTGQLDLMILEKSDYDAAKSDPAQAGQIHLYDRAATWYLAVNCVQYPPFKDKRVRQAVAHAINKDSIVKEVTRGVFLKAEGILPPGIAGYDKRFKGLTYDPEKAKALLAAAGYPGGRGLPPLRLTLVEKQPDFVKPAEVMREQLIAVGFPVQLKEAEHATALRAYHNREFDLFYTAWYADYVDPQDFLSLLLRSDATENATGYNNPAFDVLVRRGDAESDPEKRASLYAKANAIAVNDAPWVPVAYGRDVEQMRPGVTG